MTVLVLTDRGEAQQAPRHALTIATLLLGLTAFAFVGTAFNQGQLPEIQISEPQQVETSATKPRSELRNFDGRGKWGGYAR